MTNPPAEIIKQGNAAILNFFAEKITQGVDRLYEAKMMLIGEGGAGKTSLLCRLYQPNQPLPDENESTKGIEIYHHDFQLKNGRGFRLNVWDFGGQEIYHATHQFFLTKRSLYVLLDDTRKNYKSVHDVGFKLAGSRRSAGRPQSGTDFPERKKRSQQNHRPIGHQGQIGQCKGILPGQPGKSGCS